jgi:hypothetical protein
MRGSFRIGLSWVVALSWLACGPGAEPAPAPSGPAAPAEPIRVPGVGVLPEPTENGEPGRALPPGPLFRQTAEDKDLARFVKSGLTVTTGGALELGPDAISGQDVMAAGSYSGRNYYNGGLFRYGIARSQTHVFPFEFDELVPSFEVLTPPGTWAELRLSVRIGGRWSSDQVLGVWTAQSAGHVSRHSVKDGTGDELADVRTDTLHLKAPGDAVRLTVLLYSETDGVTPTLRGVAATASRAGRAPPPDTSNPSVWGTVLDVPQRSQMVYPGGGEVWCSPTSMTMLLAYWSAKLDQPALLQPVPTTVQGVHDFIYNGMGNWAFNTAHAASLANGALRAQVVRLSSMAQLERLIAAQIPVAISIAFGKGELTGAPIGSSGGHLLVVRGFTANGDVRCNDPAFPSDDEVPMTYSRAELERAWLGHSSGTTYLVYPADRALPVDPLGGWY